MALPCAWSCQRLECHVRPSGPRAPVPAPVPHTTETPVLSEEPACNTPSASFCTITVRPKLRTSIAFCKRTKSSGQSAPAILNTPVRRSDVLTWAACNAFITAYSILAIAAVEESEVGPNPSSRGSAPRVGADVTPTIDGETVLRCAL